MFRLNSQKDKKDVHIKLKQKEMNRPFITFLRLLVFHSHQ